MGVARTKKIKGRCHNRGARSVHCYCGNNSIAPYVLKVHRPIAPNCDKDLVITLLVYIVITQPYTNKQKWYMNLYKNIPIIVLFMTNYFNICHYLKS